MRQNRFWLQAKGGWAALWPDCNWRCGGIGRVRGFTNEADKCRDTDLIYGDQSRMLAVAERDQRCGHNRHRTGTATILVSPVDFNEGRSAQRCFPLVRQQAGISALSSAGARGARMPLQSTTISELIMNRLNTLFPVTDVARKTNQTQASAARMTVAFRIRTKIRR